MLTVEVKFIASELTPGLENGIYQIDEGLTVRDLIAVCENQNGVTLPEKNFKYMYPLFNGRPLTLGGAITASGTLHVCRIVFGG